MSASSLALLVGVIAFGYWYEVIRPKQTGTATNANTVPPVGLNKPS